MRRPPELTIVVPGLNVGQKAAETVRALMAVGCGMQNGLQLILINDGSTDDTGRVMDDLAREFPRNVSVLHNASRQGVGAAFKTGLARCQTEYFAICPGDNAFDVSTLDEPLKNIGKAEFILTYRVNQREARMPVRYVLSRLYSFLLKWLFWISVKDMHSLHIYPAALAREVSIADDNSFQMTVVIGLLRRKVSFLQFPVCLNSLEKHGKSRALRLSTLIDVTKTALQMRLSR